MRHKKRLLLGVSWGLVLLSYLPSTAGIEPTVPNYQSLVFTPLTADLLTPRPVSTDVIQDSLGAEPKILSSKPRINQLEPTAGSVLKSVSVGSGRWIRDPEISWYGPGFYGNRTACGLAYTREIQGVAHRSLPCGTLVEFRWKGKSIVVPVIDRGPYIEGRTWDLSGATCTYLNHCFTGPIEYRILK